MNISITRLGNNQYRMSTDFNPNDGLVPVIGFLPLSEFLSRMPDRLEGEIDLDSFFDDDDDDEYFGENPLSGLDEDTNGPLSGLSEDEDILDPLASL